MKGKSVSESTVVIVQQMIQTDANLAGNVHGGSIMHLIDSTAGIVATRHASCNVVTASIDRLDFHTPVYVGEILKLSANINLVGTSSMEVGVRVEAENVITGHNRHTASAYLTFVALDEQGKTKPVPPLVLKTDEEKRRNQEATERQKIRLAERRRERKAQN